MLLRWPEVLEIMFWNLLTLAVGAAATTCILVLFLESLVHDRVVVAAADVPFVCCLLLQTSDLIMASYGRQDLFVEYLSLQYALYMSCFVCVLGGAFFLATALFIQRDREQTEKLLRGLFVCCYFSITAFSALMLLVGRQEEHTVCKNYFLVERDDCCLSTAVVLWPAI